MMGLYFAIFLAILASGAVSQLECNFDKDLCTWSQEVNDDNFDWIRQQGSTPSGGTGPSKDHTSGAGSYIFLETSGGARGSRARLNSQTFSVEGGPSLCFQFWYHMYGESIEKLNVYLKNGAGFETLVWTRSGDQGDRWGQGELTIGHGEKHQVIIEAVKGVTYKGDIAVDDITLTSGPCISVSKPSPDADKKCDFEEIGLCSWMPGEKNDFDWSRFGDSEPIKGAGPMVDHTYGTSKGHFTAAPTSRKWQTGAKGSMVSPSYIGGKQFCFRFHYFMFNGTTETLNVYGRSSGGLGGALWSRTGPQGDKWLLGEATIPAQLGPLQVTLEAVAGTGGADISVDDLSLDEGACIPGSCDFQSDLCSWINDNSDDFDWARASGSTGSKHSGPPADHTIGTEAGYYVFIEASPSEAEAEKARLISETFPKVMQPMCLNFWFYMSGMDGGSLEVILKHRTREQIVWSYGKPMGEMWVQASVPIMKTPSKYKVIFEVFRGLGPTSGVALDDITITNGLCSLMPSDAKRTTPPAPTTTTTTPTPTTKKTPATVTTTTAVKTTKSTKTIPKTPAVQTREDLYASCSFESKCSWINTDGDEFDWQVVFGIMGAPSRGPKSDHTIGKPGRGKYAYIGAGRPRSAGDKAWTTTIESSKATSGRCLSFWYNMNGRQTGTLNVLLRSSVDGNTTDRIIWRLSGDQGEKWQKGQTPISSKVAFNIIFEGIIADGIESAIALDDISFKQGVCSVQPKAAYPAKPTTRPPTTVDPSINCASEGLLCPGQESSGDGEIEDGSGALPTEEAVKMPKPTEGIEPPTLDCDGDDCGAKTPDTPAFKPFKCDFENYTICGFIADKSADFPWSRASGRTESKNTGPASDHTNSTKDGYYMFIETSYPRLKGESALLLTPSFSPSTASRCLSFWYHMYGSDTGSLKVYLDENGDRGEAIWTKSGNLGDRWHQSYVSLPLSRLNVPHQVVMEGVVGTSYHGDIAIDDFEINEGLCPNAGASCDFESDTCGYTNSMRGSIAWTIRKDDEESETGRSSTGGSQLIMMADRKGFNAVLVSPLITPSPEGDCLSFWYRLTGPDTASLEVSLQQGETEGVPIWMKKGSQVDKLVNARVTILEKKEYKIVFKGLVGDGEGNATLDDIAFTTGRCLNEDAADCDFEASNLCGYTQELKDDLDWTWNSGSTGTFMTGPNMDHTFGRTKYGSTVQGHYLYLESSPPAKEGDKADITSPPITGISDMCLQFWYHMFGHGIGTINVYTKVAENLPELIFSNSGNQGNRWLKGEATILSATVSQGYQLVFEATRGRSFRGDLAIDDIKVNSGQTCVVGLNTSCEDQDQRCPLWAEMGDCLNNAAFMLETCKQACDNCGK